MSISSISNSGFIVGASHSPALDFNAGLDTNLGPPLGINGSNNDLYWNRHRNDNKMYKYHYSCGDLTLVDHSRSGGPLVWGIEATKERVENQPSTGTRRLQKSFGSSKDMIHRHLKSLGKIYEISNSAPRLNEIQEKRRVEVCK
ncbi:hypothetical protein EVAR_74943_1 [Eumeta japonica]|uniref:Histone-lysine N-methyltransferase SETMAR n=1 Tax=Eumeta variegata TaxID=151549 RepID=A0A4C1UI86_EUMVA|nr:hypothetical protein EVAR_74943_1 [Eumeta japonica]